MENACTALAALHVINESGIRISESAIRLGLTNARWPGRFERFADEARVVVFDGAHTPAAASALVATWRVEGLPPLATVILGMGMDKDVRAFLERLQPLIGHLIATRADSPRSVDPSEIAAIALQLGISVDEQLTVAGAVAAARSQSDRAILITGSLFIAGEGREAFGLAAADDVWRALNDANRK